MGRSRESGGETKGICETFNDSEAEEIIERSKDVIFEQVRLQLNEIPF